MSNPFAALRHFLKQSAPQPQSVSQASLINLLFHQRQCPHCHATNTVTVVPGSEAGAFDFDLVCSACATAYEVRPTPHWCEHSQEIKMHPTSDRLYTPQPEASVLSTTEAPVLQSELAYSRP